MNGFDSQRPSEVNTYSRDETTFHKGMTQKHFMAMTTDALKMSQMLDPSEIISCSISVSHSNLTLYLFMAGQIYSFSRWTVFKKKRQRECVKYSVDEVKQVEMPVLILYF